jgi:DNA-binding NarL/FixJ family response regulator
MLHQEADFQVCGEYDSGEDALLDLAELRPDLAIVDISLAGMDGIELVKNMKARFGDLGILILSMSDEALFAERALRAGANGYIMKHEGTENLVAAIRKIAKGGLYVSELMQRELLQKLIEGRGQTSGSMLQGLSDRELQIFRMIGRGCGTHNIAKTLHLSVSTVETYRARIKKKLNLNDTPALIKRAVQWNLSQQQPLDRGPEKPEM